METEYSKELDAQFLLNNQNQDFLYLETESNTKNAMLYILEHFSVSLDSKDAFGKYLMKMLKRFYQPESLTDFMSKLHKMWYSASFPDSISKEEPFHAMSYVEEPLSWRDVEQCKSICESMLDYYL